jgi:hypothetical protein
VNVSTKLPEKPEDDEQSKVSGHLSGYVGIFENKYGRGDTLVAMSNIPMSTPTREGIHLLCSSVIGPTIYLPRPIGLPNIFAGIHGGTDLTHARRQQSTTRLRKKNTKILPIWYISSTSIGRQSRCVIETLITFNGTLLR